jgi:type IV secretion system protein VirB1
MVAIVAVESSGQPWAIHDNATGATYALADEAAAIAKARELLALGRDIDIGLYQINSGHLNRGGITLANIFNPEVNANLGRTIFMEFYAAAKSLYGDTDLARR